ncbi:peptidoglycan-binding domain-containing protein [Streptomyces pratensis]|uniref:peptidoglycan-binding domain-containing protein n=1 Tax=Streptomyces pratensis TaxID=1169025 RepID=UPI00301A0BDF
MSTVKARTMGAAALCTAVFAGLAAGSPAGAAPASGEPRAAAASHSCTQPAYRNTSTYYGLYAGYSWSWKSYVGHGQSGNTSARIKEIQCLLKYAHKVDPGAVDGLWGPNTYNAVVRYQQSANLAADGIVGPLTWRSLRVGGHHVP